MRCNLVDLTGKRFGKLVVISKTGNKTACRSYIWLCKCDCGEYSYVPTNNLNSGHTTSCGCKQIEWAKSNIKVLSHTHNHIVKAKKSMEILRTNNSQEYCDGTMISRIRNPDKIGKANTSGIRGVSFVKKTNKWMATIGWKMKNYNLGLFHNINDAANARHKAEQQIYGNFVKWYDENIKEKVATK